LDLSISFVNSFTLRALDILPTGRGVYLAVFVFFLRLSSTQVSHTLCDSAEVSVMFRPVDRLHSVYMRSGAYNGTADELSQKSQYVAIMYQLRQYVGCIYFFCVIHRSSAHATLFSLWWVLQNIFPSANSEISSSPRDYVANCIACYVASGFRQFL
jgi:hypothetical protein